MEVESVPGQIGERLRHERCRHSGLMGDRVDHVPEEDEAVGAREGVGVGEVLLELPVRVLVVVGVVGPPETVHVLRDGRQVVVHPGEALGVVAGSLGDVQWVCDLDAAAGGTANERVLGLAADLVDESPFLGPLRAFFSGSREASRAKAHLRRRCRIEERRGRAAREPACRRRGPARRSCPGRPAIGPSGRRRSRRSRHLRPSARRTPRSAPSLRTASRACRRTSRRRTRPRLLRPVTEVHAPRRPYPSLVSCSRTTRHDQPSSARTLSTQLGRVERRQAAAIQGSHDVNSRV